jgi:hypothetical protein
VKTENKRLKRITSKQTSKKSQTLANIILIFNLTFYKRIRKRRQINLKNLKDDMSFSHGLGSTKELIYLQNIARVHSECVYGVLGGILVL